MVRVYGLVDLLDLRGLLSYWRPLSGVRLYGIFKPIQDSALKGLQHILILKRLIRGRLKLAGIRGAHVAPRALKGVTLHGGKGQLIVHLGLPLFLKSAIRIRWQFRLLARGELLILSSSC